MIKAIRHKLRQVFPERRVFVRSDDDTRYLQLSPFTQLVAIFGLVVLGVWLIAASAIILMDSIGSGNLRNQANRDLVLYETRLSDLATERDRRALEAANAQERFNTALAQISAMQSQVLASEERVRELETGIDVVQEKLREALKQRDEAIREEEKALALLRGEASAGGMGELELAQTLDLLTDTLERAAVERDELSDQAQLAFEAVDTLETDIKLMEEKNERIFTQLEDAVAVSVKPLDEMFKAAGMDPDALLDAVRRGYSGQGGPLTPISFSTMGDELDPDGMRANKIIERMDALNLYRLAAEKAPFMMPLRTSYRYTSGFGPRWGRMHYGSDFAGAYGSPVLSTADGVISHAGWQSGYGRLVKIKHEFGIETRYAHLSRIDVKVGQRVSRGEQIGAMGNSGRSTGTHLHYEIRVNGTAINPMIYIKAARNVF